ncbi:MAG: SIMPL domain-containing protein [Ardenticatenales bacterium]|nr:SIMPL domain-containing protein [Ardenticatenales bacterium]
MRRVTLSVLLAGLLIALSGLAINMVSAAPVAQSTATPRATGTARSATRTPLATRTSGSAASPTTGRGATASPEATAEATTTIEATEVTTDTDDLTATPEATEALTETEVITGTVLPLRLANPTDVDAGRTLTVVGLGTITTTPDIAVITLGMETTNADANAAAEENNAIIEDVLEIIDELDIPRRNVRTSTFNIYVERPPQDPVSREEGAVELPEPLYHVSQQLTVRIEDIEENLGLVTELIGAALEAGANSVSGPTFELNDDATLQQRARRAAVEDAYSRAEDWATLTGVELIGVATVSEVVGGGGPSPLAYGITREAQDAAGSGPSLQPGTLSYSEQIQIVFYVR